GGRRAGDRRDVSRAGVRSRRVRGRGPRPAPPLEPPDALRALRVHALGRHLGARRPARRGAGREAGGPAARAGGGGRPGRTRLRGFEPPAVDAVVGPVRAQAGGEREVAAGLLDAAGLLQRAAEAEVGEVVHRVALDDGGELLAGLRVAARVEVGAAERLADRALVRLQRAGLLQRDGRSVEVARLEEGAAAGEEVVHALSPLLGGLLQLAHAFTSRFASAWIFSTTSMIARATSVLSALGTSLTPSRVTIATSFSRESNPIPGCDTSFRTIASTPLHMSLSWARSAAPSPCSAAKPTTVWPGRRLAASAARTSVVGSSSTVRPSRPVFEIFETSGLAGRKSATAAAISSTSVFAKASVVAFSSSAALSTST